MKPRVLYHEAFACERPKLADFTPHTLSWLMQRYIDEMQPPMRPIGPSHLYTLRRLQREAICLKPLAKVTKQDVIDHCKERRKKVKPATVNQEVAYMASVLKYATSAWDDCADVSARVFDDAKPFLKKHNLVGKSSPRSRRPTAEEIERLMAYFEDQNKLMRTKCDMVRVSKWQIASGRRIGESCALLWADWDRENHVILVRKMKDPRGPKARFAALPKEAQALLCEWWETRDPNEPRILPYRSSTCSARYTLAKKEIGIDGLRLHDSRRECITRLIERGHTVEQVMLVSRHETPAVLSRTYMVPDPAGFKDIEARSAEGK